MKKQHLIISMLLMLMMVVFISPSAHAACGDLPGDGVDWSNCDKTNQDFTDLDLSDMILINTDFSGSFIDSTDFSGSDLTGATMNNMVTVGVGVVEATDFRGATVQGLDMSVNTGLIFANFENALGQPLLPLAPPALISIRCPDGTDIITNPPGCIWVPTAVSLAGISAAAGGLQLPFYAVGLLGIVTPLLLIGLGQRKVKTTAA